MIKFEHFGELPDQRPVDRITLKNANGSVARVITLGGILTELHMPDRHGHHSDVVLGFDRLAPYLDQHPFFGAITGRIAGRIPGGRFVLDGTTYQLPLNEGPNHLHGGVHGLDKRLWQAEDATAPQGPPAVRLSYRSPDGEEGYPGTVDIAVTYTLTETNELKIESQATSDRSTPLSMTNHSYFNLGGEGSGTIHEHELEVNAERTIKPGAHMEPLGTPLVVDGTPDDLRVRKRLGEVIPLLYQQHGGLYQLPAPGDRNLTKAATLIHRPTGRSLTVLTDERFLQLYLGKAIDPQLVGKSGRPYGPFAGLALECEGYSDGVNYPEFGDILVRPETPQQRTIVYAFTVH